jgi:histidinol-phosphate aminotransferase
MTKGIKKFASSRMFSRNAYAPGHQPEFNANLIKLNTNENPFPPSPTVKDAVLREIGRLHLYPEPYSKKLRKLIAELNKVNQDQIIVGNGSDDLLNLCVRSFADNLRPVGMLEPSYSLYPTLTSLQDSNLIKVEFEDDSFNLPSQSILNCGANLFFLTNPHAPSGRLFSQESLQTIALEIDSILVVDEAYVDFATESSINLLSRCDNVIITRTLSKSYSLAGSRVGFAISTPEIITLLDSVREVYNLDRLSQAAAYASLSDISYFNDCKGKILNERRHAYKFFTNMGWRTIESHTNFIFTEPINKFGDSGKSVARSLYEFLESRNIFTRYFPNHHLTDSKIRISIGKEEHMRILYKNINTWRNEES